MEYVKINPNTLETFKNIYKIIASNMNQGYCFDCSDMKEKIYLKGKDDYSNVTHNLIKASYPGGIVVISPGDLLFVYINKNCCEGIVKMGVQQLISFLNKNFSEYEFSLKHNDIIVNDVYKIGSFSSLEYNNTWATGLFFAFDGSQQEINKLCHKQQKYLSIGINNLKINLKLVRDEIDRLFGVDIEEQYERIRNEHTRKK